MMSVRKTIVERGDKAAGKNISGITNGKQQKVVTRAKKNTLIEELSELKVQLDALSVKSSALIVQNGQTLDIQEYPLRQDVETG